VIRTVRTAGTTSAACFYGATRLSTYAEWHDNTMTASATWVPNGGHVSQSLFTYSGSPCNNWVEVGLTQGFNGSNIYTWPAAFTVAGAVRADHAALERRSAHRSAPPW